MNEILLQGPAGVLHVDDGGAGGPPIVFIHSTGGTTGHWGEMLERLRPERRAIALDLRGHGRSGWDGLGPLDPLSLAADVEAVVDGLGLEQLVLAGHSAGGAVAVAFAGLHPERLAGLLLLDPSADGRAVPRDQAEGMLRALRSEAYGPTIEAFWAPMLAPSSPEVRERVLRDLRATSQEVVTGVLEGLLDFDPVAALSRFAGPQLSVITPFNDAPEALHRLCPRLPCERVEGTGHWLQLDAPETVGAIVERFLDSLDEGEARPKRWPVPGILPR